MSSCKLVIKDEVNVKFENLSLEWRKRLSNKFKYEIPYARHLPAVKLGRWDGKISFFGLGGTTYLNLVDQIIPILDEGGVYIDVVDQRKKHDFTFNAVDKNFLSHITWPDNHPCAGQPIELRDYQVETLAENLLFGTPEVAIEKLRLYADAGVDMFCYNPVFGIEHQFARRSLELFIERVMPAFQ